MYKSVMQEAMENSKESDHTYSAEELIENYVDKLKQEKINLRESLRRSEADKKILRAEFNKYISDTAAAHKKHRKNQNKFLVVVGIVAIALALIL